ncbi:MAG: class I SAM-dependent methyltransferase [Candidatus Sulfotelmatobacter sp.]
MMTESTRTYLPAAGYDWSLPLYDPIVKLLGGDKARMVLLDHAALRPGYRVLDIGCGTGTLATLIKRLHPDVEVVGIDPDPKALARARRKAGNAAVSIQFDQGFGDDLPYAEESFDRVFSSFMFHHLPPDEKGKTLCAVRRVLKPGGGFHMLDFEGPESGSHSVLDHLLHSSKRLKENSESTVLSLMRQSGFADPRKVHRQAMLFGHIAYFLAVG